MKKSTGIIFLVAAALAAFVYFYELKHNPPSETAGSTSKPAFSVSADDITGVTLERAGTTATFEHRPDGWYMLQPVATRADQSRLTGITSQIASLQTDRTFPVTAEQITSFGLDHPSITLAITMKNGSKHKLRFGGKDFSGSSVYVLLDEDTKNVSLIADTLLTTSDKGVEDLRDRAVLGVSAYDATSFDLVNPGGEIAGMKKDDQWTMQKPRAAAGDSSAITSLLETVNNAQITKFVSDSAADLGKYGLASPAIRFHSIGASGQSAELQIGKKDGGEYFARDASRPTIFRVNDALYKALNEKFGDLRDKQLVHFSEADISQIEVRNQNGTSHCVKSAAGDAAGGAGGQLVLQPADDKGDKGAAVPCPFVAALEMARAQEIYDEPPAAIAGKLAKAPVQVTLTNVSGKKLEIQVSAPAGDSVYARTSGGPEIYKLEKKLFDDLNSKASP